MTFDEAIEKLEQLANFEVGKTTGNIRRDFKLELGNVRDILTELRQEYAPTVEMTEMQMKQMMSFKEVNAGFSTFMYKQGLGQLPAFSDFITTQRENELMQAWLYPKTIKVVDE